ncbi:MAG: TonB-dependent receptor domain-containing protein [Vicinamibacterales bacterium]
MKPTVRILLPVIALLVFIPSAAFAQGVNTKATLTGVVQDVSGAVVPGASVTIRNVATGVTNETVSNSTGNFAVASLDPGTYQATVSLSGFKTYQVDKIVLTPGDTANITAKLEVGQATETITVSARSELVDTTSTTVSSTISSDQIQNLPVVTKSAMQIVTFLPGVNSQSTTHVQRSSTALGLPQSAIAIVIDGVNIQDQSVKSTDGFYPDIRPQNDLVEQVSIGEATSTADSSGQGAVQIKFVTRSGSNQTDGSAYEYLRDGSLNSNSWANESKGLPKNDINWNQFGFRQGGPIVIPGLYDGHNKAFYFVNYEEFRLPITSSTTRQYVSPSAQTGLFHYGCTASGCSGAVNLLQLAAKNGQVSTIDPTIGAMFSQIDNAVTTQGAIQTNINQNTLAYTWQPNLFRAEHLPGGRVDFNLTDKHRLTVTQIYQAVNSDPDIINNGYPSFPGFAIDSTQYSYRYSGSASLRSTLTKNMVNEGGWGTIWSPVYFSANITPDRYLGNFNLAFPQVPSGTNLTQFNVTGTSQARNGSNYNFHDTLSWVKGRHNFSFGGVYTRVSDFETSHSIVQGITLGFDTTNDPAAGLFSGANFPGASATDLATARDLYALLTGRVSQVTGNAVLQPNGQYVYRGDPLETIRQREIGSFAQDQWRLRPNFTINAGVRYEVQFPVQPVNSIYSRNDVMDLCGPAGLGAAATDVGFSTVGCPIGMPGIALNGAAPTYKQYTAGSPGYNLDTNNIAPTVGVAWQPSVQDGWLRTLLGDPTYATVRASYGRAFNQGGTSDFLATLRNGPGLTVNANRNTANGNLVLPGESWPILLTQTSRLAPPGACSAGGQLVGCVPAGATYPQPIVFNTGIAEFDPNYQTSYTDSWSAGFQRSLGKNTAVEVRYIGNRTLGIPATLNYNEADIYNAAFGSSSSFLNEFKQAQKNLAANVAAGKGATFAYTGIAGTAPLPIFLASYLGLPASASTDPANYKGTQWTNPATIPSLSLLTPNIGTFTAPLLSNGQINSTNGLYANPTFRANAAAAGMPANFWVLNPNVLGDNLRTAIGSQTYHTIQLLLNHRLSNGLSFGVNYAYQVQHVSQVDSLFRPIATLRSANAPPHALKVLTNYEIPVGHGQRFGDNMNRWLDGIVGNWQVNLTGRVETGRLWDIGDVKLVNLSLSDLQKEFNYYLNPTDAFVYDLPQDLIANTVKAWTIDVTSPTGHPLCNPNGSNAATCGGPDPTKPYIAPPSDASCTTVVTGDCNTRQQLLKAPIFTRFDFSAKKRFPFAKHGSFDLELDFLNVFNAIDYNSVFPTTAANFASPDAYRVTTAYADINNTYDPGGAASASLRSA